MRKNEFLTREFLDVFWEALHHRQGQLKRMMMGSECPVCCYMQRKARGIAEVNCDICPIEHECGEYLEALERVSDLLDDFIKEGARVRQELESPHPQDEEKLNNSGRCKNDSK